MTALRPRLSNDMKRKLNWPIIACLLLWAAVIWFIFSQTRKIEPTVIEKRDTVTVVETLRITEPMVAESVLVRTKIVRVPVTLTDTTVIHDSVEVALPITQKTYADSTYKAWVSGYEPCLDSIEVYRKTVTIERTLVQKPKRWSIGVTGGYGYGLLHGRPDVFVGVGVSYRLR